MTRVSLEHFVSRILDGAAYADKCRLSPGGDISGLLTENLRSAVYVALEDIFAGEEDVESIDSRALREKEAEEVKASLAEHLKGETGGNSPQEVAEFVYKQLCVALGMRSSTRKLIPKEEQEKWMNYEGLNDLVDAICEAVDEETLEKDKISIFADEEGRSKKSGRRLAKVFRRYDQLTPAMQNAFKFQCRKLIIGIAKKRRRIKSNTILDELAEHCFNHAIYALQKYNPGAKAMFSTFFANFLTPHIDEFIAKNCDQPVSSSQVREHFELRQIESYLRGKFQREPTVDEIADWAEKEAEKVAKVLHLRFWAEPLYYGDKDGDEKRIAATETGANSDHMDGRAMVERYIIEEGILTDRERLVLILLHGLYIENPTLTELLFELADRPDVAKEGEIVDKEELTALTQRRTFVPNQKGFEHSQAEIAKVLGFSREAARLAVKSAMQTITTDLTTSATPS